MVRFQDLAMGIIALLIAGSLFYALGPYINRVVQWEIGGQKGPLPQQVDYPAPTNSLAKNSYF